MIIWDRNPGPIIYTPSPSSYPEQNGVTPGHSKSKRAFLDCTGILMQSPVQSCSWGGATLLRNFSGSWGIMSAFGEKRLTTNQDTLGCASARNIFLRYICFRIMAD